MVVLRGKGGRNAGGIWVGGKRRRECNFCGRRVLFFHGTLLVPIFASPEAKGIQRLRMGERFWGVRSIQKKEYLIVFFG